MTIAKQQRRPRLIPTVTFAAFCIEFVVVLVALMGKNPHAAWAEVTGGCCGAGMVLAWQSR